MGEKLPITLVTKDASVDFTDEQYREVLLLLWDGKAQRSYPKLLEMLEEPISRKAWWHHRVTGNRTTFGPDERNKVRVAWWRHRDSDKQTQLALANHNALAAADVPLVNPSITAVTERLVHPDAAVYYVGEMTDEQSHRMVIFAPNVTHAEISANGTISARTVAEHQESAVTPVISSDKPKKAPVYRPVLSLELKERVLASGINVEELIEAGLRAVDTTNQ